MHRYQLYHHSPLTPYPYPTQATLTHHHLLQFLVYASLVLYETYRFKQVPNTNHPQMLFIGLKSYIMKNCIIGLKLRAQTESRCKLALTLTLTLTLTRLRTLSLAVIEDGLIFNWSKTGLCKSPRHRFRIRSFQPNITYRFQQVPNHTRFAIPLELFLSSEKEERRDDESSSEYHKSEF
jgi:hypothetical protein